MLASSSKGNRSRQAQREFRGPDWTPGRPPERQGRTLRQGYFSCFGLLKKPSEAASAVDRARAVIQAAKTVRKE